MRRKAHALISLRPARHAHEDFRRELTRGGGGGHGGHSGHGGHHGHFGGHFGHFGGFGNLGFHTFGGGFGGGAGGAIVSVIVSAIVVIIVIAIVLALIVAIVRFRSKAVPEPVLETAIEAPHAGVDAQNAAAVLMARAAAASRSSSTVAHGTSATFTAVVSAGHSPGAASAIVTGVAGRVPTASTNLAPSLAALREADPGFEPETFLQRAEMTYFLVNRAYQHRDATALQPYLDPALFEQRSSEIQALIENHQKPAQLDLNIRGMHVAQVHHDATGDGILVHFDLVSRDCVVDDRTGAIVTDPGDDVESGAVWLFSRKAGAKTVASGGVVAAKCPVCGAPLQLDTTGHCAHCASAVTTGEHDWVVTSMQRARFLGPVPDTFLGAQKVAPPVGFAKIAAEDPSFDTSAFLKRCAAAFEALETAWQARDLTDARGFMSPGLYFSWQAQVEQLRERHRKNVLEHLRLDRVTPMNVTHGSAFDNVMVRIDATCADYEVNDVTGHIEFGDKTPRPFTEYWTFQRGVGVKTSEKAGTFEKHCPNCGAPLAVNAVGECTYCKAAVTSGKFDWVLSRIEQAEDVSL